MKRAKIKFCGMRSKESLAYVISLGVDYLGFVVDYEKSPRNLTLDKFIELAKWLKENKKRNYKIVAVTVDMPLSKIDKLIDSRVVDVIQLHGNEGIDVINKIKGIEIWKAWNKKSTGNILEAAKHVDKILLDSGDATAKAKGSSGEFDAFDIYNKLKKEKKSVVISGGIDKDNVQFYLNKLKPEIIDVSRGIETAPGKKSKEKMKQFMKILNKS